MYKAIMSNQKIVRAVIVKALMAHEYYTLHTIPELHNVITCISTHTIAPTYGQEFMEMLCNVMHYNKRRLIMLVH